MEKDLVKIKQLVINRICILTALLFTPAYIVSLLRWYNFGWQYMYLFHTLLYGIMVYIAFFRKRIRYWRKIIIISATYLFVAILGLYNFALSGGHFYVIITLAILAILFEKKYALFITSGVFIIYVIIGIGYINKSINPITDLSELARNPIHWATTLLAIFSLTIIFIYGFGEFYSELITALNQKDSSDLKHKMLFDSANDAITLLKDGRFFDCNNKACEYFQYEKHNLIGKTVQEVSPEYQHDGLKSDEKAFELVKQTLEGNPQQFEWQHKKANGTIFDVSISLNKIELKNEIYVQGILRNITERKKKDYELERYRNDLEKLVEEKTDDLESANKELSEFNKELSVKNEIICKQNAELKATLQHLKETQAQLIQADKMASIGVLTAGIAHEINNPLNFILGGTTGIENLLINRYGIDDKSKMFLDSIKDGVHRAGGIVSGLNQLSRNNESHSEVCDLHKIIDNCQLILNNKLKHRISVKKDYSRSNLKTLGNVGKLHQVFINILSNSIQAINDKGEIKIKTAGNEKEIHISIADTGCGIRKENIKKVIEPFFTTKDPGKGTGLGLSITYNIIKDHKGTINFHSELGEGSTVEIILPIKTATNE